jgi:hypothetical protein
MYVHRASDAFSVSADSVKWLGKWVTGCSHLDMIRLKTMVKHAVSHQAPCGENVWCYGVRVVAQIKVAQRPRDILSSPEPAAEAALVVHR